MGKRYSTPPRRIKISVQRYKFYPEEHNKLKAYRELCFFYWESFIIFIAKIVFVSREYRVHRGKLVDRFWKYTESNFKDNLSCFERPFAPDGRPPVFLKEFADLNLLQGPKLSADARKNIIDIIPEGKRHRWFRSMTSSQAVAQSIFGWLHALNYFECLSDIKGDDGTPLFSDNPDELDITLEFDVDYLGESRKTNIDAWFTGSNRIAVECKFLENEIGRCSSGLKKRFCNGDYVFQLERNVRCYKTHRGVKYWEYVPQLFDWSSDVDYSPCPLKDTYQLVRNVMAACIRGDGTLDTENAHAVLVYDERNPAFQPKGSGWIAFENVKKALFDSSLIQKCSWQRIINAMRSNTEFEWLIDNLYAKYGLN